jgi:hypothetical protein
MLRLTESSMPAGFGVLALIAGIGGAARRLLATVRTNTRLPSSAEGNYLLARKTDGTYSVDYSPFTDTLVTSAIGASRRERRRTGQIRRFTSPDSPLPRAQAAQRRRRSLVTMRYPRSAQSTSSDDRFRVPPEVFNVLYNALERDHKLTRVHRSRLIERTETIAVFEAATGRLSMSPWCPKVRPEHEATTRCPPQ